MASIGSLFASLTLQSSQFHSGLRSASTASNTATSQIGGHFSKLKGVAGAALTGVAIGAVAAFAGMAKGGLDYASSLGEVAQQLGVTTATLQEYRYAATQVGISQEDMDKALGKFSISVGKAREGSVGLQESFAKLGITQKELASLSTDQLFRELADGLSKITDPARRAALEVALFGKTGQKLDTLLAGGTGKVDALRNAAHRLGIVLSEDQIRNADDVADKLAEVKLVLQANIAGVVANNAASIISLANSLGQVTSSIIGFLNSNPQGALAILGGLAGARLGPIGAGVGAAAGYMSGSNIKTSMEDSNSNPKYRQQRLGAARAELSERLKNSRSGVGFGRIRRSKNDSSGNTLQDATNEVYRQQKLFRASLGKPKNTQANTPFVMAGGGGSGGGGGGGGKAKRGGGSGGGKSGGSDDTQRKAEDAARNLARYTEDEAQQRADIASALAELSGDIRLRSDAEIGQLEARRVSEIDRLTSDKDLTAVQKATLIANVNQLAAINKSLEAQKTEESLRTDAMTLLQAGIQTEEELLRSKLSLARSAQERQAIELQLLALGYKSIRAEQDRVIASTNATAAEKQAAKNKLSSLPAKEALDTANIAKNNLGPMAGYLNSLPQSAAEINESLQSIAVDGLKSLNDGLTDAILSGKSLKDVFGDMAKSIISDLLKIAIQQAIIKPLASLLGGGSSGGGGILGSILGIGASALGGGSGLSSLFSSGSSILASSSASMLSSSLSAYGRANGGSAMAGKSYWVGERGPEMFRPTSNGQIISNSRIGGGGGPVFNIDARGSTNPAETKRMIGEALFAAMPTFTQNAVSATKSNFTRPRL